jgi:hypothetical protein
MRIHIPLLRRRIPRHLEAQFPRDQSPSRPRLVPQRRPRLTAIRPFESTPKERNTTSVSVFLSKGAHRRRGCSFSSSSSLAAVVFFALIVGTSTPASSAEPNECLKSSEQGLAARDAGKLREARKQFVVCAADNCQPKALRIDCARWLEEVEASLPTVVFGAKDARGADLFDLSVTVDGEKVSGHESGKAFPFDPGPHVVRFEQANGTTVEEKILLRAGERNRPIIAKFGAKKEDPKPPPPPPPQEQSIPTSTIVLGVLGLGAMGSFTFFAVTGSQEKENLKGTCGSRCSDDQISTLKTRYIVADVSLGVGIVALGLATYFWLANNAKK